MHDVRAKSKCVLSNGTFHANCILVMEYLDGGDLYDYISVDRLEEGMTREYFHQLVSAVKYLH